MGLSIFTMPGIIYAFLLFTGGPYSVRGKKVPEKWSPGKQIPGKMVPWKKGPREKWSPEKWSLVKLFIVLKLFSVKKILGIWTTFLFSSTDSTTHTKRCLTFTSQSCMHQTVAHERSPGRFVVEFWVFIDWSHPNIPPTHHDARRLLHDFSGDHFSGDFLFGNFFPRDHFSGTFFPRIVLR